MQQAVEAAVVAEEDFATPDCAVVAEAGAVEDQAEDFGGAVEVVFGHGGGQVGVVVLDFNEREP